MNKSFNILRFSFHILNFITIVLYLYPGSIMGWLIYGDIQYELQLTKKYLKNLLLIVVEAVHYHT